MGVAIDLVLASSSPTRRQQLSRLGIPFTAVSPDVDETPKPNESPKDLVLRLSAAKAQAVANRYSESWIVAGDQVQDLAGSIQGKSHHHDAALAQLMQCSGRVATFYSGLALLRPQLHRSHVAVVTTEVHFKPFSEAEADAYLRLDQPYACAGSIKLESWGFVLIERMISEDPQAILGVPLLRLRELMAFEGFDWCGHLAQLISVSQASDDSPRG